MSSAAADRSSVVVGSQPATVTGHSPLISTKGSTPGSTALVTVAWQGNQNSLGNFTGVGPFRHDDPRDRPAAVFGGDVTLHAGPGRHAYVMLPVIPEK